ncbi:hypothetical protein BG011_000945 [Mortierella polycephala]|uniref:Uncharacterized protein n=1 Tax=Mortierella polycephala TaxID=41804 RepID=A0A9P6Q847_9FUNG|nr:hypothetical protein BG011_000945 [Mortierella polycephala]
MASVGSVMALYPRTKATTTADITKIYYSRSPVIRERHDRQQEQQHRQQQGRQPHPANSTLSLSPSIFPLQPSLPIIQEHDAKEAAPLQQARSLYNAARTHSSPLEVVPGETLKSLETENNLRIWDHIIIGEGQETLQSACQIAQQNPTDSVLVIVQEDIQPTTVQRIVQWAQQLVAVQAQRLWEQEALGALSELQQDHIPDRINARLSSSTLHNKTRPLDAQSLPTNIYVGSSLCATKILIDKSVTTQMALNSSPKPVQVKRFSSIGGSPKTSLTINTTPPVPARTVGLEVVDVKNLQGPCYQVFCRNNVIFATGEHPIIRSLSSNTTPLISRESTAEQCATSNMSDDTSRRPRILLSVRMRHDKPRTLIAQLTHWSVMASQRLLASLSLALRQLVRDPMNGSVAQHKDRTLDLQSVVIHESNRVFQHGRVRQRQEDDSEEEILRLDISASRTSLDTSTPIQVLVSVFSQPMLQDTFENADIIRKSEAVLLEGLVLARELAQTAGWSCLEEDDSQMVEWVRDQMDIQWIMENGTNSRTLAPVCTSIEGVKTYARSLSSNSSIRVRTPKLSPYASRTTSYQGKHKNEGLGIKNIGDTTLERLQNASESLQSMEDERYGCAENTNGDRGQSPKSSPIHGSPKVTIATVEAPSALRKSLKTSFGGFSSLSDSRTQTMVLSEKTEDHLGMALSLTSPLGGSASATPIQDSISAFGDGVTSSDLCVTSNSGSASSPPEPKKLSRFSIKTYQLERSKHGLSDEWGIGGLGLNANVSSAKKDALSPTSPLIADHAFAGNVSSLGPRSDILLQKDFLEYLDPFAGRKTSTQTSNLEHRSNHDSEGDEPPRNLSLGSNVADNGSRRRYESRVGSFSNVSGTGSRSGATSSFSPFSKSRSPSPLRVTAELVPDFLGDSFAMPKSIVSHDGSDSIMERTQSCPNTGSTKAVHFAETETRDMLARAKSEQAMPAATSLSGVKGDSSLEIARPLLSTNLSSSSILSSCTTSSSSSSSPSLSASAASRSKAHTRRSWGKGIGGNDILGIQGLSE